MHKLTTTIIAALVIMLLASGCEVGSKSAEELGSEAQTEMLERAFDVVPPYQPTAFPGRDAINRSLRAGEQGPWHVYALAFDGTPLFYIVSEFRPYNKCHSITSPERLQRFSKQGLGSVDAIAKAPALDGIYYSSGGCHTYVVEDVTTGSIIDLSGSTFTIVASLRPLNIETDPLISESDG